MVSNEAADEPSTETYSDVVSGESSPESLNLSEGVTPERIVKAGIKRAGDVRRALHHGFAEAGYLLDIRSSKK